MARTDTTSAGAQADLQEQLRHLPPEYRRYALKAASMRFKRRRVNATHFVGEAWKRRSEREQLLHLCVARLMSMTDSQLTRQLADPKARDEACEAMLGIAEYAKVFQDCRDVFRHAAMRVMCAYARNELELGRDGKPRGDGRAA